MTNEQILAVLSLSKNPLINYSDISLHEGKRFHGTISAALDAEQERVDDLILSVFPGSHLSGGEEYELSEDGSYLYKIRWLHLDNLSLSVHYNKKAPANTEDEETYQLDSNTLAEMSASVERGA